jgi:prephenate dehydratase
MNALLTDPASEVAYLGPEGSFSHLVAKQRFPNPNAQKFLKPFRSVPEIFDYVDENENALGIVPIENSSGGMILQTVDGLIEHAIRDACSLFIQEELSINVRLSLLGKAGREIRNIYSHFIPFHHCEKYLVQNYPGVRQVQCTSTSAAAEEALRDPFGAAIAPAVSADRFGLDILEGHLLKEIKNVTQFFVVGKGKHEPG